MTDRRAELKCEICDSVEAFLEENDRDPGTVMIFAVMLGELARYAGKAAIPGSKTSLEAEASIEAARFLVDC